MLDSRFALACRVFGHLLYSTLRLKFVKAILCQVFPQKFELYGQHELRIGSGQGFSSSKGGLAALQKGFDAIG